jgi:hypothetical protein
MDHCYNGCDDPAPYRSKHNEHYDCDFAQDFEFCDIHDDDYTYALLY